MYDSKTNKESRLFLSRLSKNLVISIRLSSFVSSHLGEKKVSPTSLLAGILLNDGSIAQKAVSETGINVTKILEVLLGKKNIEITGNPNKQVEIELSKDSKEILNRAFFIAQRAGHVYVEIGRASCRERV